MAPGSGSTIRLTPTPPLWSKPDAVDGHVAEVDVRDDGQVQRLRRGDGHLAGGLLDAHVARRRSAGRARSGRASTGRRPGRSSAPSECVGVQTRWPTPSCRLACEPAKATNPMTAGTNSTVMLHGVRRSAMPDQQAGAEDRGGEPEVQRDGDPVRGVDQAEREQRAAEDDERAELDREGAPQPLAARGTRLGDPARRLGAPRRAASVAAARVAAARGRAPGRCPWSAARVGRTTRPRPAGSAAAGSRVRPRGGRRSPPG